MQKSRVGEIGGQAILRKMGLVPWAECQGTIGVEELCIEQLLHKKCEYFPHHWLHTLQQAVSDQKSVSLKMPFHLNQIQSGAVSFEEHKSDQIDFSLVPVVCQVSFQ